ncbi:MAG: hypothetical protein ABW200_07910 [Hyphomicrobiaceae bacterium]|jgi:hypothetical protein
MTNIERSPQKMILKSGSTTLTFDKEAGKVTRQRKVLLWARHPTESPLSDIAEVKVDAATDPMSGAEVCSTRLVLRTGVGWVLPAADKRDATATTEAVRDFLGLHS